MTQDAEQENYYGVPHNLYPVIHAWLPATGQTMEYREPLAPDIQTIKYLHARVDSTNSKQWATVLPELVNVKYLEIKGIINQAVLDGIGKMTNLQRLDAGYVRAKNLDTLSQLQQVDILNLYGMSSITNIDAISGLSSLSSLGLGIGPKIKSIDDFNNLPLPKLRCILFWGSSESKPLQLTDLKSISSQTSLEYVMPWHVRCDDPDVSSLLELPNLKAFSIFNRKWWHAEQLKQLEKNGINVASHLPIRRE